MQPLKVWQATLVIGTLSESGCTKVDRGDIVEIVSFDIFFTQETKVKCYQLISSSLKRLGWSGGQTAHLQMVIEAMMMVVILMKVVRNVIALMMVMIIRAMGLVTVIIILNTWASPRGLESEGNEILIKMRRRRIEDWIGKIVGQKWWYWCWWMQWIRYYGNDDEEGTKVVMMMRSPRGHRGRGW